MLAQTLWISHCPWHSANLRILSLVTAAKAANKHNKVHCHNDDVVSGGGDVGRCLTSQQHACISQGLTCSDNCTCCQVEVVAADQTCILTKAEYPDSGQTSPRAGPITKANKQTKQNRFQVHVSLWNQPYRLTQCQGSDWPVDIDPRFSGCGWHDLPLLAAVNVWRKAGSIMADYAINYNIKV